MYGMKVVENHDIEDEYKKKTTLIFFIKDEFYTIWMPIV